MPMIWTKCDYELKYIIENEYLGYKEREKITF